MNLLIINKAGARLFTQKLAKSNCARIIKMMKRKLQKENKGALRRLSTSNGLTLVFVGRTEMKKLNQHYRGKNKPTDILSFAPTEAHSLGELVFCSPIVKSQAKAHKLTIQHEYTYLLIHGILHLLGYDHETNDRAARRMYRLQDSIFEKL